MIVEVGKPKKSIPCDLANIEENFPREAVIHSRCTLKKVSKERPLILIRRPAFFEDHLNFGVRTVVEGTWHLHH